MERWDLLARHHRRVVDDFIEDMLDRMDLDGAERNVAGVALRREVETVLVPGLSAVMALMLVRTLMPWLGCRSGWTGCRR